VYNAMYDSGKSALNSRKNEHVVLRHVC
jgi:hypothetical protein